MAGAAEAAVEADPGEAKDARPPTPEEPVEGPGMRALWMYAERFHKADVAGAVAIGRRSEAFTWQQAYTDEDSEDEDAKQGVRAALERDMGGLELVLCPDVAELARDKLMLCKLCSLPLGELVYEDRQGEEWGFTHGECMAQLVLRDMQQERLERERRQREEKLARRREFDIGWQAERVPRSLGPARRLRGCAAPEGLCCLVLEEGGHSVALAPTAEPAAAVNLEYLSTALRVRKRHGREPLFSLDPVGGAADRRKSMQEKRFEPAWLVGTSVGEVLFQSDYHLKELSMGEYDQPVVGMKSCFDFSEEEGCLKEWNAREWFVVRRAEVQLSEDNALIPSLRMAVEAREQVKGEHGLEDVKTTRPNHPLVRYAEAFSHNFDLIAERKSVVYHLRELAKAAVLAKFLLEAGVRLDPSWLELAGEPSELCALELPQLWNDRIRSQIQVQDGKIMNVDSGFDQNSYSLYGGVQFGLDRFQLSGRGSARPFSAGLSATQLASPSRYLSAGLSTRQFQRSFGPMGVHQAVQPRGVDLNLDQFSLSAAAGGREGRVVAEQPCVDVGSAFWSSICEDSDVPFKREAKALFRSIFSPSLSDRRADADVFAPPDTSPLYMQRLRALVRDEERVRRERKAHFCSAAFDADAPGPLFPSAWKAALEISREGQPRRELHARADYKAQASLVNRALKSAVPAFDKSTEEGLRFRVYRVGGLEVRTLQEPSGPETAAAVFSALPDEHAAPRSSAREDESISKVTEYVERASNGKDRHSFVVLETEGGGALRTERLPDGAAVWEENPKDLRDRSSLAKVVRAGGQGKWSVGELKKLLDKGAWRAAAGRAGSEAYAQAAFCMALGVGVTGGFREV